MNKFFRIAAVVLSTLLSALCFASCSSKGGGDYDNYYQLNGLDFEEGYAYESVIENDFIDTQTQPLSTFKLDRNTASYTLMRRQINSGAQVATDSVRLEEYVNYFNYPTFTVPDGETLCVNASLFDCPWNSANKLLALNVKACEIEFSGTRNNLVFLIDTSGSMYGSDRLELVQEAFALLTESLSDNDVVSIVTYAGSSSVALDGANGSQKTKILSTIGGLNAGGSTAGADGIQTAYAIAEKHFISGGNNRIILATDGDFNVGMSSTASLKNYISQKRADGYYFSALGVGMGNTRDDMLETLANNGDGNYAYLDSVLEAQKVLVSEINGTLVTVAKDAKAQVSFTESVEKYRLLGYENKLITVEEYEDTATDSGEIGSGHVVNAIYEIKLKEGLSTENVATASVKYKDVAAQNADSERSVTIAANQLQAQPNEDLVFMGCVAEYALLLRNSKYKASASFEQVLARLGTLETVTSDDLRADFLTVVNSAYRLYRN